PDPVLPNLVVDRLGVALDRVLRRGVTGHVRRGDESEHRRDVDDPTISRGAHVREYRLRHPDEPEEVDIEDALVLSDRAFLRGPGCAGARVVVQSVERPGPLNPATCSVVHRLVLIN